MALTPEEQMLVEAVDSMLNGKARLGLPGDTKTPAYDDRKNRGASYLHGQIEELFAHKAAELTHHTGACAAFAKIHTFKCLDDNDFAEAMNREMVAQGIPQGEREKATGFIPTIINELKSESGSGWSERDFGFHPDLGEIIEVSQPEQFEG